MVWLGGGEGWARLRKLEAEIRVGCVPLRSCLKARHRRRVWLCPDHMSNVQSNTVEAIAIEPPTAQGVPRRGRGGDDEDEGEAARHVIPTRSPLVASRVSRRARSTVEAAMSRGRKMQQMCIPASPDGVRHPLIGRAHRRAHHHRLTFARNQNQGEQSHADPGKSPPC